MLTARLAAVAFSIRIAGLSLPSSSRCVRNICVYGERLLEENTSQRPLGEKLCQEFISGVLQRMRRACAARRGHDVELAVGTHQLAVAACTKTIQRPSGETLGKLLLMPLCDAPAIGSGLPALRRR